MKFAMMERGDKKCKELVSWEADQLLFDVSGVQRKEIQ